MLIAVRAREHYAQYLDRPLVWFGYHLRWLPLVVPTYIAAVYAARYGVYELVGRPYQHQHPPWLWVFVFETLRLVLFAALWLGILFGFDSYTQWQIHRRRLLEVQKALTEAQLARLKGQLRPHFFFNVLNTISALMHVDVARADRLVAGLGDLLHISLRSGEQEMTPLREELRSLELYAEIMHERFRDRVTLNSHVDPSILDTPVPSLILQPLLENAFRHGVERSTVPVRIDVTARREGNSLSLVVNNTGSSLASDYREGVGLRNCRERLSIIYGEAAALQVRDEGASVAARVSIPLAGGAA
jgi:LytS/YehU family sensor histidine kinase